MLKRDARTTGIKQYNNFNFSHSTKITTPSAHELWAMIHVKKGKTCGVVARASYQSPSTDSEVESRLRKPKTQ